MIKKAGPNIIRPAWNLEHNMNSNFNFNAKQVLLTYPQCSLSKELVFQALDSLSSIKEYVIALEKHQDGSPHIHAVLSFKSRYHTKNPRAFDLEGHHPNIQGLKTVADFKRACKYAQKDSDFITNIHERKSPNQQLAEELLTVGLTPQFVRDNPTIIFKNFNSIRSWINFAKPLKFRPLSVQKKRHVWLYGPSNTGKTTWLRALRELYVACEVPENNDFSHLTQDVEIIYIDEFKGHLTVQQLNRYADGDTWLNTKGGSVHLPLVTFIIVSNYSISDCYKNCPNHILETINNRFHSYDSAYKLPPFPKYIINL